MHTKTKYKDSRIRVRDLKIMEEVGAIKRRDQEEQGKGRRSVKDSAMEIRLKVGRFASGARKCLPDRVFWPYRVLGSRFKPRHFHRVNYDNDM